MSMQRGCLAGTGLLAAVIVVAVALAGAPSTTANETRAVS
jgi:hypothetical protein